MNRCGLTLTLMVMAFAGCWSGQPVGDVVATVPAEGVLLYQGKPLAFHQITVIPADNRPAIGVSDEEGKFILGTNAPNDGAVMGTHAYSVHYVGPPSNDPEEGMNTFTTPPPPAVKIPANYGDAKKSGLQIQIPSGGDRQLTLALK